MTVYAALEQALPKLTGRDVEFATSLIAGAKRYGGFTVKQQFWVDKLVLKASTPPQAQAPATKVGDLGGILAIFERSSKALKFPAIALGVPGFDPIRINVAGAKARVPGSLTVVSEGRDAEGSRKWFGRVLRDGTFEASRALPEQGRVAIEKRLQAFAADPSKIGAEDAKLNGRCCFCRLPLTDERSTEVGYGAKCAKNWGLRWGKT